MDSPELEDISSFKFCIYYAYVHNYPPLYNILVL